jgi:hypothetical protein
MSNSVRFSTAVHEVGHALVAMTCGVSVLRVRVDMDGRSGGTDTGLPERTLDLTEEVAIPLAGRVAIDLIGCKVPPPEVFEGDFTLIRAALERREIDELTDEGNAVGQAVREKARTLARAIIEPLLDKVRAAATALAEAGELTGDELAALLGQGRS